MRLHPLALCSTICILLLSATSAYAEGFIFPPPRRAGAAYILHTTRSFDEYPTGKKYQKATKLDWGLSFDYPDNWQYQDMAKYVFVEPSEGMDISTLRKANIVTTVKQLHAPMSLSMLHKDFMLNAARDAVGNGYSDQTIPSFALISSGSTTLAGHPALSYVFNCEDGGRPAEAHAVVTAINNRWMEVSLITPPEFFKSDEDIFQRVLNSLVLVDVPSTKRPTAAEKFSASFSHLSSKKSSAGRSSSSSIKKTARPMYRKK